VSRKSDWLVIAVAGWLDMFRLFLTPAKTAQEELRSTWLWANALVDSAGAAAASDECFLCPTPPNLGWHNMIYLMYGISPVTLRQSTMAKWTIHENHIVDDFPTQSSIMWSIYNISCGISQPAHDFLRPVKVWCCCLQSHSLDSGRWGCPSWVDDCISTFGDGSKPHIPIWGFPWMGIPQARWMVYFMENPSINGW